MNAKKLFAVDMQTWLLHLIVQLVLKLNLLLEHQKIIRNNTNNNSEKDISHGWNETFVDNKWIIQDVTWDAGGIDETTRKFTFQLSDKYFNTSPNKFLLNHTKTEER